MKNLLYIGNNLQIKGANVSSVQILGNFLQREGYQVFYASSKMNIFFRFTDMLWSCFWYRRRIDVVLIDTYSTLNFYYAWGVSQFCRLLKLPYVPILHGGNLPHRLENNPRLCRLIFKNAKCCVSPSRYLQKAFNDRGYKNVHYIPNALILENYPYQLRNLQEVNLLWVRSFAGIYNPRLAVDVLSKLKMENLPVSLCMVGPDNDGSLAKVKALAKELHVEVRFTGKLTKQEWVHLAKEYTIFINTTNFDNMPVSVLEAMALGLPVVSTNVGGLPFLIQHEKEGLLVPPRDAQAFVNAIKRLIKQPVFTSSMVFNARKKVEQFDWDIVRFQWHEVLSS